ncbi:putative Polyprenyl synthetase [Trypanosoma vivax]|nr:putative Polyprenyl synthetase [Trypanosoma vivax]
MACILYDAIEEVTYAKKDFGLGIGVAFQIVCDALNIKLFNNRLKGTIDEFSSRKIRYPVVKALRKLNQPQRERLWNILQERTSDINISREFSNLLNSVDAVNDCFIDARKILDENWSVIDLYLNDSGAKVMKTLCLSIVNLAS